MSKIQDDHPAALAEKAHKATISTVELTRKSLVVAAVGVIVSIAGVAVGCGADQPTQQGGMVQGGTGNTAQECGFVGNAATCVNYKVELSEAIAKASDDAELKKVLRASPSAAQDPAPPGPWPFAVVDTGDLGLFARTTPDALATRVGHAANRGMVWADCQVDSEFTPPDVSGENAVGPKWVKVRWKHLPDGTNRGLSEPSHTETAFMYRGALEPVAHNGNIPPCAD